MSSKAPLTAKTFTDYCNSMRSRAKVSGQISSLIVHKVEATHVPDLDGIAAAIDGLDAEGSVANLTRPLVAPGYDSATG